MLGEVRLGGQYRDDDLRLIGDFDSDHLARTLTEQAVSARSRGHIVTSRVEADQPVRSDTDDRLVHPRAAGTGQAVHPLRLGVRSGHESDGSQGPEAGVL
ncbi:MAG: hypothetical protein HC834_03905 [Rhodospirillales bacterium]|nr:hypothetical protein [Rhodospirillales bacterium]